MGMMNRYIGKNLSDGYVQENFYRCYDGALLVDVFSLKFELTEFLLNYGGHIGCAVRPSERNRGIATKMLKQGVKIAKQFGFDRVLCVCDEENYASKKVILKNEVSLKMNCMIQMKMLLLRDIEYNCNTFYKFQFVDVLDK